MQGVGQPSFQNCHRWQLRSSDLYQNYRTNVLSDKQNSAQVDNPDLMANPITQHVRGVNNSWTHYIGMAVDTNCCDALRGCFLLNMHCLQRRGHAKGCSVPTGPTTCANNEKG